MEITALADVRGEEVSWLWPNRLPLGKLAMLDGDPGTGKSLVTLDLCARLSVGGAFPDGAMPAGACGTIILNAEDALADTIAPRLARLGADLGKVFTLSGANGGEFGSFMLPGNLPDLAKAVVTSGAKLVVIDPVMAFLDRQIVTGSDQSVRRVLTPLAELAQREQVTILMVRHLTKKGRQALYRGGGSIGMLGACRSGWLAARDVNSDVERFVLTETKNNLARGQRGLVYALGPGEGESPMIRWLGTTEMPADELLRPPVHLGVGPRASARQFLTQMLGEGPLPYDEIMRQAMNIKLRTLFRAKDELGIQSVRLQKQGEWILYWAMPGQLTGEHEAGHGDRSNQIPA